MARRVGFLGAMPPSSGFTVDRLSISGTKKDGCPAKPISVDVRRDKGSVDAAVRKLDGGLRSLLTIVIRTPTYHAQMTIGGGGPANRFVVSVNYGTTKDPLVAEWVACRPRSEQPAEIGRRRAAGEQDVNVGGEVNPHPVDEIVGLGTALAAARIWVEWACRDKRIRWKPATWMKGRARELAARYA